MSGVSYRRGSARDRAALEGLLRGLSPESAYSRFQTALGSGPPAAVIDALLPESGRGGVLLAWDAAELVAHGLWVRVGASRAAEVALVVTDSHQQRGIGTALAEGLLAAAADRGIDQIEVFSEARNLAVARMVAHRAPAASRVRDGVTISYSFVIGGRARRAGEQWQPRAA